MSRFIPEGKSDFKDLQTKEKAAYKKFQEEKEDEERLSLYDQLKLNYLAKEQEYEDKVKSRNQSSQLTEREIEFYKNLEDAKNSKEREKKREIEEGLEEYEQYVKETFSTFTFQRLSKVTNTTLRLKRKKENSSSKLFTTSAEPVIVAKTIPIKITKKSKVTKKISKSLQGKPKETINASAITGIKGTKSPIVSGYESSSDSD